MSLRVYLLSEVIHQADQVVIVYRTVHACISHFVLDTGLSGVVLQRIKLGGQVQGIM